PSASPSTRATPASRARRTPRAWAASSSASYRGDGTPAAASWRVAEPSSVVRSGIAGEAGGEVGVDGGLHDGVEVAVEHLVQVVRLVAGAVVGDAVLRKVVRADALGAVDGAHLAAAGIGRRGVGGLLRRGEQPRPQDAQGRLLVLQLGLLVLAGDDDAGGQVRDAYCGVRGVDALAARPAGPVDVDPQVGRLDRDVDVLGL